jgi:galactokinase
MDISLINKIKNSFKIEFSTNPLMVFSPGRINLIGEHVDYNDGLVFPAGRVLPNIDARDFTYHYFLSLRC